MSNTTLTAKKGQGQQAAGSLTTFFNNYGPYLAFGQALVATLGSLYFSEIRLFIPCTLCWYQRILMYPLVLIILVGLIKQDEYLPSYVLPFSIIGLAVSSYHYLIQLGVLGDTGSCSGIACSTRYVNYFGFVTIPFLALVAFAVITAVMLVTRRAYNQSAEA